MSFMTAAWWTVGLFGLALALGGVYVAVCHEEGDTGYGAKLFAYWWRRAIVLFVVLLLVAIWVPVFVPGLY